MSDYKISRALIHRLPRPAVSIHCLILDLLAATNRASSCRCNALPRWTKAKIHGARFRFHFGASLKRPGQLRLEAGFVAEAAGIFLDLLQRARGGEGIRPWSTTRPQGRQKQVLLGLMKIETTVRYLGVDVEDRVDLGSGNRDLTGAGELPLAVRLLHPAARRHKQPFKLSPLGS